MLKNLGLLVIALLFSVPLAWAANPLDELMQKMVVNMVLGETPEVAKLGEFVLGRPVRSSSELHAFLTRLELEQFQGLASDLEVRLRKIDTEVPAEGTIPTQARAALLRDAAARSLSFAVNPSGQLEFIDLHTAQGSLRANSEAFLHPELDTALERFNGRMLRVHRISEEMRGPDGKVDLQTVLGPGESVFMGVSDGGHFSLTVGNERYDGKMAGEPALSVNALGEPMEGGLLIRFNDVSPASLASLREGMHSGFQPFTISCVNGACIQLNNAGILLRGAGDLPIYRSHVLERIIEMGFENSAGASQRYDIIMNSENTFEDFFARMKSKDIAYRRLLKIAQSKNVITQANLMQELGLTETKLDPITRRGFLALMEHGVPTLIIFAVPVIASQGDGAQ